MSEWVGGFGAGRRPFLLLLRLSSSSSLTRGAAPQGFDTDNVRGERGRKASRAPTAALIGQRVRRKLGRPMRREWAGGLASSFLSIKSRREKSV